MHRSETIEGGRVVRLKNSTPLTLLKGYIVKADVANDDSVVLVATVDFDPIGIIYENIAPGQTGLIVIGGIADVFLDNALPVDREQWVGVSTVVAGMGTATTVPVPPNADRHFQEIGHTIRTKGPGPGLCRCMIHFL